MGIHEGHRDRMRDRFLQYGLDSFNEIEALEMLLYYAVPRKDTNELAHALLDHFGSLYFVFSASVEELCEVPGISRNAAVLLMLAPQIVRKSEIGRASRVTTVNCVEDAVEVLSPRMKDEEDEIMMLVCLDGKKRISHMEVMSHGVVNGVSVDVRRVVELALKHKAVSVIIAHNHPHGPSMPSREDDTTTSLIYNALNTVGIKLYDHIIIAGDNYASYRRSGALDLYRFKY